MTKAATGILSARARVIDMREHVTRTHTRTHNHSNRARTPFQLGLINFASQHQLNYLCHVEEEVVWERPQRQRRRSARGKETEVKCATTRKRPLRLKIIKTVYPINFSCCWRWCCCCFFSESLRAEKQRWTHTHARTHTWEHYFVRR